jgi:membrane-bound lytic murein transglycosylase B
MKRLLILVTLLAFSTASHAATPADAQAALANAVKVETQAAGLGNRWVPTEAALKAARDAIAKQNWDEALAQAKTADALAQRAVAQSQEQETLWRDAVIR